MAACAQHVPVCPHPPRCRLPPGVTEPDQLPPWGRSGRRAARPRLQLTCGGPWEPAGCGRLEVGGGSPEVSQKLRRALSGASAARGRGGAGPHPWLGPQTLVVALSRGRSSGRSRQGRVPALGVLPLPCPCPRVFVPLHASVSPLPLPRTQSGGARPRLLRPHVQSPAEVAGIRVSTRGFAGRAQFVAFCDASAARAVAEPRGAQGLSPHAGAARRLRGARHQAAACLSPGSSPRRFWPWACGRLRWTPPSMPA